MKKLESSLLNMVLVLTLVAVVMGGILAYVNHLTEGPINEQKNKALADGIAIAMGTTLLGLLSAVPLLVIVGLLNMNSERLIQEMEEKGLKIINSLV